MIKSKQVSCHGCLLRLNDSCTWFARPKHIPHDVFQKGCKHRVAKTESLEYHPTIERILDLFQGELM